MNDYRIVKTSGLRPGDVVVVEGSMRCLIDRELQVSEAHPVASDGSRCRYTSALVLNRDEVPGDIIPKGWTADWDRTQPKDAPRPHHGEHRWTIQGNDLARWAVERKLFPVGD